MKINKISVYDVKFYLKRHSLSYISFLVLLLVGVVFGVLIGLASDNYLKILNKENKVLYSIINGAFSSGSFFGKKLVQLIIPLIVIFLLNLNFYVGLLSYLIIAYQSGLLTLTIFAMVSVYRISGVLNVILIVVPINLVYLAIMIFFASACVARSRSAFVAKNFTYGMKSTEFLSVIVISVILVFVLVFVSVIVLPFVLKNAIFIIF